jgi:hypothetical protein
MEGGRWSRARGGTDDDRGEREKIVGLHDHGKATAMLDSAAATRKRDRVDVTPNHEAVP